MTNLLLLKTSPGATPITLVPEKEYKAWLGRQKPQTAGWLKTLAFDSKPGKFCVVPDAKGKPARVIVGLSDPVSMWDLSALPCCVPKGAYYLESKTAPGDLEKLALGWLLGSYRYTRYKNSDADPSKLALPGKTDTAKIRRMAESIALARDLINTPASDMGPAELAKAVENAAKTCKAKIAIVKGNDLLKKNYPAIHAVGRASAREPRLIDLTWGNPRHPKITLIGKGVCFDTGGLDIKPSGSMIQMKKDMAGAACALAAAMLVMKSKLPVRLRVLIPAVENAIGPDSFRPSDVIKMRGGQTVEVGNTDAEGRLILAEALTEASKENPKLMIDFSTLTGAARTAVGTGIAALFSNDDKLAEGLLQAGIETEDPLWRLPLHKAYESMLDSHIADMNSSPNSPHAGAITAALFLQRFVGKKIRWAHLDFMGWNMSAKSGRPEGGEAMGVRAVYRLIEKQLRSL